MLWLGIFSYRMAKFTVKMVFSIPVVVAFVLLSSVIPGLYSLHLSPARLTSLSVTVWIVCTSHCHLPLESHQCVHFATLCSILCREDQTQRQLENRLLNLSSFQTLEKGNSSEMWDCNFKNCVSCKCCTHGVCPLPHRRYSALLHPSVVWVQCPQLRWLLSEGNGCYEHLGLENETEPCWSALLSCQSCSSRLHVSMWVCAKPPENLCKLTEFVLNSLAWE